MIAQETLQQLQHAPIADRIQVIEVLFQSLKQDIVPYKPHQAAHEPFTVRTFNLGADIHHDREDMYAEN